MHASVCICTHLYVSGLDDEAMQVRCVLFREVVVLVYVNKAAGITIWGWFWADLEAKMGPLRLICAWFAREIHDRASKVQFWQILGRFWTPKSVKNRAEIVICAWLAREIHELPELLIFWSILEAIFMKFWCQKRAWNEIRKDVKQVKALHCQLCDFVKKLKVS